MDYYSVIQSSFTALKNPLSFTCSSLHLSISPPKLLVTTGVFALSMPRLFQDCHAVGIVYYVALSDLFSLNNVILVPPFFSWFDNSFIFLNLYLIEC